MLHLRNLYDPFPGSPETYAAGCHFGSLFECTFKSELFLNQKKSVGSMKYISGAQGVHRLNPGRENISL